MGLQARLCWGLVFYHHCTRGLGDRWKSLPIYDDFIIYISVYLHCLNSNTLFNAFSIGHKFNILYKQYSGVIGGSPFCAPKGRSVTVN